MTDMKFKAGDVVAVKTESARKNYKRIGNAEIHLPNLGGFATVKSAYVEAETERVVYRTTMGEYYEDQLTEIP